MPSPIDRFIAGQLARMRLDDAQRAAVEANLRRRLDEAAAAAQAAAGFSREQAERDALFAFTQPLGWRGPLADLFGAKGMFVGRLALSVMVCLPLSLYLFSHLPHYDAMPLRLMIMMPEVFLTLLLEAAIVAAFLIVTASALWDRVDFDGRLIVRRILRRTVAIPLDRMGAIEIQRNRPLLPPRVGISDDERTVWVPVSRRGLPLAVAALEPLAGHRIEDDLKASLFPPAMRVRRDGALFKAAFSLAWLGVAATWLLWLAPVWQGIGISRLAAVPCVLTPALAQAQRVFQGHRKRKGAAGLLALALLFTAFPCLFAMNGWHQLAQTLFLFFGALVMAAVLLIWWRGPLRGWVGLTAVLCLAAILTGFFHPLFPGVSIARLDESGARPSSGRLSEENGRLVWRSFSWKTPGRFDEPSVAMEPYRVDSGPWPLARTLYSVAMDEYRLENGRWTHTRTLPMRDFGPRMPGWLIAPRRPGEVWLYGWRNEGQEIGRLRDDGVVEYLDSLTTAILPSDWNPRVPIWSPDGRYLLAAIGEYSPWNPRSYIAYDLETKTTRTLLADYVTTDGGYTRIESARWSGDHELIAAVSHTPATIGLLPMRGPQPDSIRRMSINVATGECRTLREYSLTGEETCWLPGGEYVLLSSWSAMIQPQVLNLASGARVPWPNFWSRGPNFTYDWSETSHRTVYFTDPRPGAPARLIVADAERGEISTITLPAGEQILGAWISPPGNCMAFIRQAPLGGNDVAFSRLELWNLRETRARPIRMLGANAPFAYHMLPDVLSVRPRWSRDERIFAYPSAEFYLNWHGLRLRTVIEAAELK
jgi:hypothetical protein